MAMASLQCFTALPPLSSSFSPLSHSTTLNSLPLFSSSTASPTSAVLTSSHPLFPAADGRCRWRGCQASSQDGNFSVGETLDKRREPMVPPYNVLITGSTKGIGFALAKEFLKAGDNVVICSRSAERVESAVQNLRQEFGDLQVWGTVCDVREGKDVKALVSYAREKLNYIDIWINNAGSNAYSYKPLAEASDEDLMEVVSTNTLGLMICCREAIKMMLHQPRGGHVFNMDGAGSDGRPTPRFAAYGATKRSVVHLTKSLQAELRMQEVKNVMVHNLSPGMVTTDLLMSGAKTKQAKFFINVLAEPAEVVANYIVPSVRSVVNNGSMRPTYIRFLTGLKRLAFGARRNRYMIED